MNKLRRKILPIIVIAALLLSFTTAFAATAELYTVKSGDTLYTISQSQGMTVAQLSVYNTLGSSSLNVGQKLALIPNIRYTVKSGDTLWLIASRYSTTIDRIKTLNALTSDGLNVGQVLILPLKTPTPVPVFPSIKYVVLAGDTATSIAKKFGVSAQSILTNNYMSSNDWFDEGETIAINGYAPRYYSTVPGMTSAAARTGGLVDWFNDGQYLLKRNDTFRITDVATGKAFSVKMMGGVNHSDVEPLTAADTAVVKALFPTYKWDPRPVVIYKDGMNIAASFSGMPHSFDTIADNGVTGHFDLYLYNSKGHSATTSQVYMDQHKANVLIAAGIK